MPATNMTLHNTSQHHRLALIYETKVTWPTIEILIWKITLRLPYSETRIVEQSLVVEKLCVNFQSYLWRGDNIKADLKDRVVVMEQVDGTNSISRLVAILNIVTCYRMDSVTNNSTRVRIGYRIYSLWRFTAAHITITENILTMVLVVS
jgi:hypothetical protein